MEFEVRQYRSTDKKEVWDVHLTTVLEAGFPRTVAALDYDHDIETEFLNSGGDFLVATASNKIIGMGGVKRKSPRIGEITRMRTHPNYQRMGVGAEILAKLESSARKLGMFTICLDTANHKVRGFYEENGYLFVKSKSDGDYEYLFFEKALS